MERKLNVYETVVERIRREIELGIREKGERLPSCRDFAMQLGINPNTVQKAYAELEMQGYIYAIPKKGVYVGEKKIKNDMLQVEKERFIQLRDSGVKKEQLVSLLDEVYGEETNE